MFESFQIWHYANKDMLIFEVHNEDNSIFYMVQNMDIWIFKIYNEDNTILYKVYNREMLEFANLQILTDANYSTLIMKKNLYFSCTQSPGAPNEDTVQNHLT